MSRLVFLLALLVPTAAMAHPGHSGTAGFLAGVQHPLSGIDHIAVALAVGLWAALKGGRALWVWPAAFVALMLVGAGLNLAHVALPFVEPGILASVVVVGLMVAFAVDLPVWLGGVMLGAFALFHGYAHVAEVPENASGFEFMLGFTLATAALQGIGIASGKALTSARRQPLVRAAGAACAVLGVVLAVQVL
ncbi:MAG TPA: HupE/UreJ family protein [Xanthobacteraceae bacterium]|nr:HupE/UreJ family protein [Xanthobacteraceae bacterium]